ncbi:hypothetical protein [Amycolatopsis keratiniphila]|uniref:hypothetical protein n=1 Tax=Amycolatopsis keratiniphila TaxID=129921 RepID=UPI00087BE56E|nr:hypothetical protein [Amycolatopsis keratiniphila]OLZ47258.1 hypothetical protein BS330_34910 [Amycolatopsis keratiniphila subsp. nogabecina]SDU38661.1 hypothetical protein SAMN04489733_3639 [Amycolatopsis keratiniphila]
MSTHPYAPESQAALSDLLRAELAAAPLPRDSGPRPRGRGMREVRPADGGLTADAMGWILDAATPDSDVLRFTVAARDVDGLDTGWYEFREGAFHPVKIADELPVPPATVLVSGGLEAIREGGVHLWRRALLATGAAGEVAGSHAGAVGYAFRTIAADRIVSDADFRIQAWAFAPADGTS